MSLGQEELGRRIKRAREEAGLTQPQLADRIGLRHPQSISNYERGMTEVPAARLRKIAEATGHPMTYFVADPDAGETIVRNEELALLRGELAELRGLVAQLLPEAPPRSPDEEQQPATRRRAS